MTRSFAPTLQRLATAAACGLLLSACASRSLPHPAPETTLPAQFHHQAGWLAVAALPDGPAAAQNATWWTAFQDPVLSQLLADVTAANPNLAQALARLRQAQAAVDAAGAAAAPQVGVSGSATRSGGSDGTPTVNRFAAGLDIGWEPDLWGRIGLQQQAAQSDASASEADHRALRLALQLRAAQHYVRLRSLELQQVLLAQTLQAFERSLQLTRNQYAAGLIARADVILAETQWQSVRTQVLGNQRQHALERNALAELTGRTPGELSLPQAAALPGLPAVPAQLPTALLVRRPDLAAAQHQLAAANARVGVAQTAWLPDLNLGLSAGLQSGSWSQWLQAPVRAWSLGPRLAATLFDGGARRAALAQSEAGYDALAAGWRASVLQAVRETEDALSSLALLAEQTGQQATLAALAEENLRVVNNRYAAGVVSYLEVATAQNLALNSRRAALETQADRLLASMALIAALGGGWGSTP
ncbi:efflux transporter outer membrane subunit [Hydrogenophaga palleronii]|uniref:efflux transporter outer membrane subunit n=1 Tax=Hydrogenophaga palleronii TaxID=65655 RepID=UPI000A756BBC|nr:efflux transporter outer membrane subunit [Hydrogenophaga palleronii]